MKTRISSLGRIISVLLTVLMVFALTVPAFAATVPTAYNPNAHITVGKTLSASQPGVWPAVSEFSFLLKPVSYTEGPNSTNPLYTSYTTANLPMPATEGNVTLNGDNTATIRVTGFDSAAVGIVQTQTTVTPDITYTQSGIYTYQLNEVIPATRVDGVTYDETVYFVNVYVTNVLNDDGTPVLRSNGTPVVTVSAITAFKATNGTVNDMQGQDFGGVGADTSADDAKTAIVIPGDDDGDSRNIMYPFVNTYNTNDLIITKKVTGNLADPFKEFTFTLDLKKADGTTDDTATYSCAIYDMGEDGAVSLGDLAAADKNTFLSIKDNDTFTLKHNQYIVITGLPDGEVVSVTENDYSGANGGYITSYKINNAADPTNGAAAVKTIETTAGAINLIDFFNYKQSTPPTGVMFDMLPFVMIAVIAVGGLLVVLKKRRTEDR